SEDVRRRVLEGASELTDNERGTEGILKRLVFPVTGWFGAAFAQALPQTRVRQVEKLLVQAGEPMPPGSFFTILGVGCALSLFLAVLIFVRASGLLILAGPFVAIYGSLTPYLLLRRKASKRRKQIERGLPDTIDLLLTSVEAGLGIDAAFALVAERS